MGMGLLHHHVLAQLEVQPQLQLTGKILDGCLSCRIGECAPATAAAAAACSI